jgi:hypothetical protein
MHKATDLYFDIDLLGDEDNDDISTSGWKKFLSKKRESTFNAYS